MTFYLQLLYRGFWGQPMMKSSWAVISHQTLLPFSPRLLRSPDSLSSSILFGNNIQSGKMMESRGLYKDREREQSRGERRAGLKDLGNRSRPQVPLWHFPSSIQKEEMDGFSFPSLERLNSLYLSSLSETACPLPDFLSLFFSFLFQWLSFTYCLSACSVICISYTRKTIYCMQPLFHLNTHTHACIQTNT